MDKLDGIKEPEEISIYLAEVKAIHMAIFAKRMSPLFGSDEAGRAMKEETISDVAKVLDEKIAWIEQRNKTLFSQATYSIYKQNLLSVGVSESSISFMLNWFEMEFALYIVKFENSSFHQVKARRCPTRWIACVVNAGSDTPYPFVHDVFRGRCGARERTGW